MTDARDQRLTQIFRNGWPEPRPGMEARVQAALASVRPRRHPNLVTIIVVTLILLVLAAGAYAAVRFFVKGTLRSYDVTWTPAQGWGEAEHKTAQSFGGEAESRTAGDAWQFPDAVVSPDGKEIAFRESGDWPPTQGDVLRASPDGSHQVNLTQAAGLGGVNCVPAWSPDGRLIGFDHSDPAPGELPCRAGFYAWVMNRDATGAHRVMPPGFGPTRWMTWAPDGAHALLCVPDYSGNIPGHGTHAQPQALLTDLWGRKAEPVPNVGDDAAYSPDGAMIVTIRFAPAVRDGRAGCLNRLVVTKADGSDPRVLVEQFIADADIARRYPTPEQQAYSARAKGGYNWISDVRHHVGPKDPVWSPDGRAIAFLAALPYDPEGILYRNQIEVWVYDLTTSRLIRMTHDQVDHARLSWRK